MTEEKRKQYSWYGSFAFHLFLFLLLGLTGILKLPALPTDDDIVEVSFYGDAGSTSSSSTDTSTDNKSDSITTSEPTIPEPLETTSPLPNINHTENKTTSTALSTTGQHSNRYTGHGSQSGQGTQGSSASGQGAGTNEITAAPAVPPRLTKQVKPIYPRAERNHHVEGTVVLRFLLGKTGEIENITILSSSGSEALDEAALQAAHQWRFTPAQKESGQPVRCYISIPIQFHIT